MPGELDIDRIVAGFHDQNFGMGDPLNFATRAWGVATECVPDAELEAATDRLA